VASSSITLIQSFVKIGQLVKAYKCLESRIHTHHNGIILLLSYLLRKKSRIKMGKVGSRAGDILNTIMTFYKLIGIKILFNLLLCLVVSRVI
jgi:hypothetical protein